MNLLVVFDAVYTERNLTRAAEVLHITQPAVSNALARLRKSFGEPLFVRTAEGMIPTPGAKRIAASVREALKLVRACMEQNAAFDPATSEMTLHCSLTEVAEAMVLPGLIARLRKVAPRTTLRSYYVPRDELPLAFRAGRLDFAVDVSFVSDNDLHHEPILEEEYVLAVRQGHPAIRRRPTLKQYLALDHVHVSSRRRGLGIVDQRLRTLGCRRAIVARVRNYMAACLIVANTDLACTLPRVLATHAGLNTYSLPFETSALSLHCYWHKSAQTDPLNTWLRELVTEVAARA